MIKLAESTKYLVPSPTLKANEKVKQLVAAGKDIINLTVGEPNFYEPAEASAAAIQAIQDHFTHYTASSGVLSLREKIAAKLAQENGLTYEPSEIVVSTGAKQALFNALSVLLNPGDEVLLPTPIWPTYEAQVLLTGGQPSFITLDEKTNFKLTPTILEASITERSRVLILTTPSNPTGSVYTKEELLALAPVIEGHNLVVISDEIYERLTYEVTFTSVPTVSPYLRENTILVNGFSKSFGMTGWRVGYTAAPKEVTEKIAALQSQVTAGITSIAQVAAEHAALHFEPQHVVDLKLNRDLMAETLTKIDGIELPALPAGAFYLFPNVAGLYGRTLAGKLITNAEDLCELLIDEIGVAATAGTAFHAPNNIRLSYAKSYKEIETACERLRSFLPAKQ